MPFQPYKSERGPDFISLALQLRREQRQEESQNRRDEAALLSAQTSAFRERSEQARLDEKDKRDQELFELERLKRRDEAEEALRPGYLAARERAADDIASTAADWEQSLSPETREVVTTDSDFSQIVQNLDPGFVKRETQPLVEAGQRIKQQVQPYEDRLRQLDRTPADVLNREQGRLRREDEEFLAGDPGDIKKMTMLADRRDRLLARLDDPNLSRADRQQMIDRAQDFQGRLNRFKTEGVTVDDRQLTSEATKQTIAVRQGQSMLSALGKFVALAKANPSAIGAGPSFEMVGSDAVGAFQSIRDSISAILPDALDYVSGIDRDELESDEAKGWLQRLESNADIASGDFQMISDLKILGDLVALSVVRLNAGDRISTPIFEKIAKQFNFSRATSPKALVRAMETAQGVLRTQVNNANDVLQIKYLSNPWIDPISRRTLRDAARQANQQGPPMAFPSLEAPSSIPILRDFPKFPEDVSELNDDELLSVFGIRTGAP